MVNWIVEIESNPKYFARFSINNNLIVVLVNANVYVVNTYLYDELTYTCVYSSFIIQGFKMTNMCNMYLL